MSDSFDNQLVGKVQQIRKNADQFMKMVRLYQRLSLDRVANYFKMVDILNNIETVYLKIESGLTQLKFDQWLNEEKRNLSGVEGRITYEFGRLLVDLLSKSGFKLEGNFPELKTKMLLIDANTRSAKCQLWYGYKEEFLLSIPLSPESANKAIISSYNRIAKRDFDDASFIATLLKAYQAVIGRQQKQIGDQVGIIDVLVELNFQRQDQRFKANPRKSTFRDYPREFFSYDLYKLKQREINGLVLSLAIASREQNRHRESYLWIPSEDSLQGNVYSQLSFRRVK